MNQLFPCKCGCSYEMHYKFKKGYGVQFNKIISLPCKIHEGILKRLCLNYNPMSNLEYLERKYDQTR